jgi:copper resistance protein C
VKRRAFLLTAAGALCALATPASAHALLESANPRVGSTIAAMPNEVRLRFSEGVTPALSHVELLDAQGHQVALAALCNLANDRRTLCAALQARIAPGVYRVRWRVVSLDSHATQGDFTFTLRA